MCRNATRYNEPDSDVHVCATRLQEQGVALFRRLQKECVSYTSTQPLIDCLALWHSSAPPSHVCACINSHSISADLPTACRPHPLVTPSLWSHFALPLASGSTETLALTRKIQVASTLPLVFALPTRRGMGKLCYLSPGYHSVRCGTTSASLT